MSDRLGSGWRWRFSGLKHSGVFTQYLNRDGPAMILREENISPLQTAFGYKAIFKQSSVHLSIGERERDYSEVETYPEMVNPAIKFFPLWRYGNTHLNAEEQQTAKA